MGTRIKRIRRMFTDFSIIIYPHYPRKSASGFFTIYFKQHCLYFFPLPQMQGSFRPIVIVFTIGFGGFSRRSTSEMSSGLSGSIPTVTFQLFLSQSTIISVARSIVCTRAIAGFPLVPNFAIFFIFVFISRKVAKKILFQGGGQFVPTLVKNTFSITLLLVCCHHFNQGTICPLVEISNSFFF